MMLRSSPYSFFFFNDTATTEIYTLSLHDALPICQGAGHGQLRLPGHQVGRAGAQGLQRQRTAHGGPARTARQPQGAAQARGQQPRSQGQAQPPAHQAQCQGGHQRGTRGGQQGHEQAQVQAGQRIHVGRQPLQQACGPQAQAQGGGGRGPAAQQPLAQGGQHGQGGVMGDQPFGIARARAAQGQQAYAGRGHEDVENDGRGRQQN